MRIEKIDSETHENILHDGAIFQIYAAKRDDSPDGNGQVMFYEEDTTVTGSREFLEAMRAERITPVKRSQEDGAGTLYSGVVPAGTPIVRNLNRSSREMLSENGQLRLNPIRQSGTGL